MNLFRKKSFWIVIVVIILVVAGALFWNYNFSKFNKVTVCNPYGNFKELVQTGNLLGCDCLSDEAIKSQCQANLFNNVLYTEAVKKTNAGICQDILSVEMKTACQNVVAEKIKFLAKNSVLKASTTNNTK